MDLCVCDTGTFLLPAPTNTSSLSNGATAAENAAAGGESAAAAGKTYSCEACSSVHETKSVAMTDCSSPGATLERMPLQPGYWRQSESARFVRSCVFPGNASCVGGDNVSAQCAEGYRGPLCNLCDDDYYGGRGVACQRCEGDPGIAIGRYVVLTSRCY